MSQKTVSLLLDTIYDNTGDKAIRIVMERFLRGSKLAYEVLDPTRLPPCDNRLLIIGGGHLLHEPGTPYYDFFRVPGAHILNAVTASATTDVSYLNDYLYVSVRSMDDLKRLSGQVRDVQVVPDVVAAYRPGRVQPAPIRRATIGLHFAEYIPGIERELAKFREYDLVFIPFTHYAHDTTAMRRMARHIRGSRLLPYMQPDELFATISKLSALVCVSLHASIFAYVNNVPFLVYGQPGTKVFGYWADRGMEAHLFQSPQQLRAKLERLLNDPPDYSAPLERDLKQLDEHFYRMADIIAANHPITIPDLSEVASHIDCLRDQLRERDFQQARYLSILEQLRPKELVPASVVSEASRLGVRSKETLRRRGVLGFLKGALGYLVHRYRTWRNRYFDATLVLKIRESLTNESK